MCECVYTCVYIHVCVCPCVHAHVFLCVGMFMCVHVYAHVFMCVRMCVYACIQRYQVSFSTARLVFGDRVSLSELGAHWLSEAGWPASPTFPPASTFHTGMTGACHCTQLFLWVLGIQTQVPTLA